MEKMKGTVSIQRPETNLRGVERGLSIIMGFVASIYGLRQKDAFGLGMLVSGGYLLYRGLSGRCWIYNFLGVNGRSGPDLAPVEETPPSVRRGDKVTESSWESFPTSDPPSWTTGR